MLWLHELCVAGSGAVQWQSAQQHGPRRGLAGPQALGGSASGAAQRCCAQGEPRVLPERLVILNAENKWALLPI